MRTTTSARARIRRFRALALVVLAIAAIATMSSFYLANTGLSTVAVQPASNLPSGHAYDVANMASSISRPNGNASIQAGVALARVKIANGLGSRLKVDVAWLDPQDANQVLNNPNAQLYVSLYYPVAQNPSVGNCGVGKTYDDTIARITDDLGDGSVDYCAEVDQGALGSLMTDSGQLAISRTNLSGYLAFRSGTVTEPDAGSGPSCDSTNAHAWCHPTALDSSTNVIWVAVTIVTPGGKPAGQQNTIDSLSFFVQAKSV